MKVKYDADVGGLILAQTSDDFSWICDVSILIVHAKV